MEKWQKDEVLTALDKATIDYAKIKFCDVARSLGYKYINRDRFKFCVNVKN